MKVKIDKRDKLFSLLVRHRSGFKCECCGTQYSADNSRGLECAHIISRRYKGLRWEPLNAISLCTGCHMNFTGHPLSYTDWIGRRLTKDQLASLRSSSQKICKLSKHDLEDIYQNLKRMWAEMSRERRAGIGGRIEFESPYPSDRVREAA